MKTIEFKGITSGDHECFCFDVDKETFERIMDEVPGRFDRSGLNDGTYRLYPCDIFGNEDGAMLKVKVEVEEFDPDVDIDKEMVWERYNKPGGKGKIKVEFNDDDGEYD